MRTRWGHRDAARGNRRAVLMRARVRRSAWHVLLVGFSLALPYDLVLADVVDVPALRREAGGSASKPVVLPLLYNPTPGELAAAERAANCSVRPSKKSQDLLAVVDETMRERRKGSVAVCQTAGTR